MTEDNKFNGPFFVRSADGKYELAPMCEECAFGDENVCALTPCTYLFAMTESEDEDG